MLHLIAAALLFILGLWFISTKRLKGSIPLVWYSWIMGTLLIVTSGWTLYHGIKTRNLQPQKNSTASESTFWRTDYQTALDEARSKNVPLVVKFGATWCSSCTAIEKRFATDQELIDGLKNMIFVSIDCTRQDNPLTQELQKKFDVKGYPAIIVLNPQSEDISARLGSDIASWENTQIIDYFKKFAK